MIRNLKYIGAALLISESLIGGSHAQGNSIDQSMFYRSFIQDAPACSVSVKDGAFVFADSVASTAASTCPDAFAWTQYLEAIDDRFWEWGTDQTTWPNEPWPICTVEGQTECCDLDVLENKNDAEGMDHCPINRASYPGQSPLVATPNGIPNGVILDHRGLTNVEKQDPGRLLRDLELEIVFRNSAMVEYIFKEDLFSKEGLGARNRAMNAALGGKLDIGKAHSLEVRFPTDATMVKADFIHQDIMIAQGLIPAEGSNGKPPNDAENPYLTVYIEGPKVLEYIQSGQVDDCIKALGAADCTKALKGLKELVLLGMDDSILKCLDGPGIEACISDVEAFLVKLAEEEESYYDPSGYYYMLAMTNASKWLPGWHWYAMEHVNNLGRCDYIGCNDSFGYAVTPTEGAGTSFGPHFVPPKTGQQNDKATLVPANGKPVTNPNDFIFITGEVYDPAETGEVITDDLRALFAGMGIGQGDAEDVNPKVISKTDPAWMSYRLKGTQTQFTTKTGVPTGMGATITEGGFVNSASCMTCHAQASVDENGNSGMQGVGSDWRLNLFGFSQVKMGSPDAAWFYNGGAAPTYSASPIDFVWGILGAACQKPVDPANAHGQCKADSYYEEPKIPYTANAEERSEY